MGEEELMADITKCRDNKCTRKEKCYRYTAPEGKRQSVFAYSPREGKKCEYFWNNKGWGS